MLQKANAVPTKLPNLENVYLKKKITINKNSSALKITLGDRNAKLCGICGAKHAPGERHKTNVISPSRGLTINNNFPKLTPKLTLGINSGALKKGVSSKFNDLKSLQKTDESEKIDSTKGMNRELGLGRAPGIDLAAIYSNMGGG